MITVGDLLAVLRLRDEMSPQVDNATAALGRFHHLAEMSTYQLTLFGRGVRQAGSFLTGAFTLPLVGAAVASTKLAASFEEVTTRLVTLGNVQERELEGVRKKLLEMAPAVGIGPVALGEAMYVVSSRLENTATAMEVLKISAKGAAVGMGDVKTVAGALTTIVNSYGEKNITAAHAADVMAVAIKRGGAEAKDLAPTLANVVPFAAQLGISFEEVAANLATITAVGVPTSEAVTQLTSIFAGLTRETNQGKAALAKIGTSYAEIKAEIKERGLTAVLLELTEKLKDNQSALFKTFGRLEAYKNLMGTTQSQAELYVRNLQHMKDAHGDLDQMYDKASKTFSHLWKQFVVEVEVAAVELGTELLPIMKDLINMIRDDFIPVIRGLITGFKELPDWTQKGVLGLLAFGAVIGPLMFSIGQLIMAIGNIGRAVGFLTFGSLIEGATAAGGALEKLGLAFLGLQTIVVGVLGFLGGAAIGKIWNSIDEAREAAERANRKAAEDSMVLQWAVEQTGKIVPLAEAHRMFTDAANKSSDAQLKFGESAKLAVSHLPTSISLVASHGNTAKVAAQEVQTLAQRVAALTAEQKLAITSLKAQGYTNQQVATETGIAADVIGVFTRQTASAGKAANKAATDMKPFLEAMEELNSVGKTAQDTINEMDGDIVEAVKYYLEAGIGQERLATAYELTAAQVRAINSVVEENKRIQREANQESERYAEAWEELNAIGVDYSATVRDLDTGTIAYIKHALQAGATQGSLATAFSLTKTQVKAIAIELDKETDALKEAAQNQERYAKAMREAQSIGGNYRETIRGIHKTTVEWTRSMIEAGMSIEDIALLTSLTDVQIKAIKKSIEGLSKELTALGGALSTLGSSFGDGGFGQVLDGLGKMFTAMGEIVQSGRLWKKGMSELTSENGDVVAGTMVLATAGLQMAGAFMKATETGNTFQKMFSGAATGAMIGSQIAPGIGTVIGAIGGAAAGFLRGIFGKTDRQKEIEEAQSDINALKQTLLDTYGGMERLRRVSILTGEDITEAFGHKGKDGLAMFEAQAKKMEDRLKEIQGVMKDIEKDGGFASQQILDYVNLFEGQDKDVRAYQISNIGRAIIGMKSFLESSSVSTQEMASGMISGIMAAFGENMRQGVGLPNTLSALSPVIELLEKKMQEAGLEGTAAFGTLRDMVKLAGDEVAGPAFTAVSSLNDVLVNMHNAGILTQDTFAGIASQVGATFDALVAQGYNGNQVLALMQPTLQTMWQLQRDFGFEVDASTQKLIDQATEAGLVGEAHRSAQDRAAAALERTAFILEKIAQVLGADIPDAAEEAARGIEDAVSGINIPEIEIPITFDVPDLPNFDKGGLMPNDGLAYLHAGERVLTPQQQSSSSSSRDRMPEVLEVNVDGENFLRIFTSTAKRRGFLG